jgi:hypothetical protein
VTGPRTENTSFNFLINAGRVSPQSGSSAAVAAIKLRFKRRRLFPGLI